VNPLRRKTETLRPSEPWAKKKASARRMRKKRGQHSEAAVMGLHDEGIEASNRAGHEKS